MFDFRLKVFHTVAKRFNFTKAAGELYITQLAVTKHIQEIEGYYKVKLFQRNGSRITLTEPGEVLLEYTERIFKIYRDIEFDLNAFTQSYQGHLRVGASTTVAQYILPPLLADFHVKFRDIKVSLLTENTNYIEKYLEQNNLDLAIIEGRSKNTSFKYSEFIKDEIVLVTATNHTKEKKGYIRVEELLKAPFLLREPGSGTLEFIAYELKKVGIKLSDLNIEMQMNSSESIKAYLLNSRCMAFLSIHSVLKELARDELRIVDVKGLNIERFFNIIHPHGGLDGLADLFMRYALNYNFK